ncbi:SIS domain-containing protein [Devosia sp. A8/3-2]|nr:SIS domain-containing protein [Devosia sp. A8/3-2]
MRRFDGRPATRADQMIDVRPGDTAILFDVRRYDPSLLEVATDLTARRAQIILITDEWMSPVSRYAKLVLPCRTALDRTRDANGSLFTPVEAIIARVTGIGPADCEQADWLDRAGRGAVGGLVTEATPPTVSFRRRPESMSVAIRIHPAPGWPSARIPACAGMIPCS